MSLIGLLVLHDIQIYPVQSQMALIPMGNYNKVREKLEAKLASC